MTKSKDRVNFFLPKKYFQRHATNMSSAMERNVCKGILKRAFGISSNDSHHMMQEWPEGFWITCRPSQFARFIVYRNESGNCINGIRDLKPKLVPEEPDVYSQLAEITGVCRQDVKTVLTAVNERAEQIVNQSSSSTYGELDVSNRFGDARCG